MVHELSGADVIVDVNRGISGTYIYVCNSNYDAAYVHMDNLQELIEILQKIKLEHGENNGQSDQIKE